MLPWIFLFAFCLWVPRVTHGQEGRNLSRTISLSKFKVNLVVDCDALNEGGSSFRHWVLPNLVVIGGNQTGPNYRNVNINPDNFSLSISRIAMDQMGDYLCYAEGPSGRPVYSRTSVFLSFPPVWETYRLNFIMSLSASGVFVVIATVCCVASSLRRRETAPDNASRQEPHPGKSRESGPGVPRGDFEPAARPKDATSDVTVFDDVRVPGVTKVEVVPAGEQVKPGINVEDETVM